MNRIAPDALGKNVPRFWKLPILLGAVLIAVIWIAVALQITAERKAAFLMIEQEAMNLALVYEQNTERTASEIDRTIRYLRSSYELHGHAADWPSLVQQEFTLSNRTIQIAIIDRNGMMVTSTKMLYPPKPIDLSDREHFRVHVDAREDTLFISKPVLGRASNQWSVQFTRRFTDQAGNFAGVIVVSLDPSFLTRSFSSLKLGKSGGLAVVGDDGIVRAQVGATGGVLGERLKLHERMHGADITFLEGEGNPKVAVRRTLTRFPLSCYLVRSDHPAYEAWLSNRTSYRLGGGLLTAMVLVTIAMSLLRRRAHEQELHNLARLDSLTRLVNRAEFRATLKALVSGADKSRTFSLHLLDLDDFKQVNDNHGHPVGDQLLIAVGERLRRGVRSTDVVARLGGDEFALLQMGAPSEEQATALGERICSLVSAPYSISGKRLEIGVSVGIVANAHHYSSEEELIHAADMALYSAKGAGGKVAHVYSEKMTQAHNERKEMEDGLRNALRDGHLELHYQPICHAKTLQLCGVEALIRWRHPTRGLIPPATFIPIAEQTGLIVEIGEWVLDTACRDIAGASSTLNVAVNVSAIEFREGNIAHRIEKALERSGLPPKRLRIEITESVLMKHDSTTQRELAQIREMGCSISVDDFGTGYSSLSYLQQYTLQCIKIDRSFVKDLRTTEASASIVAAIVQLARALNMTTVAEGTETEEQLDELRRIGCDYVQGYLLGRPQPLHQLISISGDGERAVA